MIYLCRVRVLLRWINTYYLCAVFVCLVCVPCVEVWILFKCGYIRFMLYSLYSGHYKCSTLLLWYVADFLLVNIYALCNGLRNKELRVSVSGITADLAHFYA